MYFFFSSPSPSLPSTAAEEEYILVGQRYILSRRSLLSVATEVKMSIASKVLSGIDALDREDVDLLRNSDGGNASHVSALRRMDDPMISSSEASLAGSGGWL